MLYRRYNTNIKVFSGYTEWKDVATKKGVTLYGPMAEGKKFQIKTDAKIESGHDIRFFMNGNTNYFTVEASEINVRMCGSYPIEETAGFRSRGGILTFLKTQTTLKIWFDDVLEVDWDFSANDDCVMRSNTTKIQFHLKGLMDKASKQYRFSTGTGKTINLLAVCYIVVLKVHFLYLIKMQLFQLIDFYRTLEVH